MEPFETFYERQYWPVARLAAAMTGRWDVGEELAQDAFVALYRRWDEVMGYDAPEAWIRRVVLNRSLSVLRRRSTEARLAFRLAQQSDHQVESSRPDGTIWAHVARLSRRQAEVVALVYLEDRSVADTASVLGCDETTVRTHLHRARRALARTLQVDVEEELP